MVAEGRVQIPDFQRPVVLRDEWVRTLLASVSLGYPIGAVMLLPRPEEGYPFPVLPLPGASASSRTPDFLLVDGQHRVSALFQALIAPGTVALAGGETHSYAFDIAAALEDDLDRVASVIPATSGVVAQFPLVEVFGERDRAEPVGPTVMSEFERSVLSNIQSYRVPVIELDPATTLWTIRVRSGANGLELAKKYRAAGRPEL